MKLEHEEAVIRAALSTIETPGYDIEAEVRRQKEAPAAPVRHRLPRAVLIAACLALALAVGAAAVIGVSANWSYFFAPLPNASVTTVGVSQTAGDYTLTLEDAVVDDNGALLLLALTRADGGQVDPQARFNGFTMHAQLLVEGEPFGDSGFQGRQLSEDGRTLYLVFEARRAAMMPGETILGKRLTLRTDGVARQLWDPAEYSGGRDLRVSLAPLAETGAVEAADRWDRDQAGSDDLGALLEAQGVDLPLTLDEQFPLYRVRGAAMTKRGLGLAISTGRSSSGDLACGGIWVEALVDTRDGTRYQYGGGSSADLPDGTHVMLETFRDGPLGPADLPYLELEFTYEMDRILSDRGFSLDFTAGSGASVILPLDEDVTLDGEVFHVDELRLSAVQVSVGITETGERYGCLEASPPVLSMKDGSTLALTYHGGGARFDREAWTYDGTFTASYAAKDAEGQRVFFDLDQVASVTFGDLEVPIG